MCSLSRLTYCSTSSSHSLGLLRVMLSTGLQVYLHVFHFEQECFWTWVAPSYEDSSVGAFKHFQSSLLLKCIKIMNFHSWIQRLNPSLQSVWSSALAVLPLQPFSSMVLGRYLLPSCQTGSKLS